MPSRSRPDSTRGRRHARSDLGTNIVERLDTFKSAADAFAPPTMLAELSNPVDATTLAPRPPGVRAATSLAHLLLNELQALLQARAAEARQASDGSPPSRPRPRHRRLIMLWFAIAGRPRAQPRSSVRHTGRHRVGSLAYARDLLDSGELARPVAARREETAMLSRLSIRQKLALLLVIPLTAVGLVMAGYAVERLNDARDHGTTARSAQAARNVGGLIDTLQQERLISVGYLAVPSLQRTRARRVDPDRGRRHRPARRRPADRDR
jgi:hypothetical protein